MQSVTKDSTTSSAIVAISQHATVLLMLHLGSLFWLVMQPLSSLRPDQAMESTARQTGTMRLMKTPKELMPIDTARYE